MNRNFGTLDQIGVVVRHLDRVRESMESIFGILPTESAVNNYEGISYRGEIVDTAMESLVYRHFGIELEFIAPLGSENVWDDFLQQRGEGLFHLRFQVRDQTTVMLELADLGISVAQAVDPSTGSGAGYAYFDSVPELGFTLQTSNGESAARKDDTARPDPEPLSIPLSLPLACGSETPLLLNLLDISDGHTTLRFRTREPGGSGGDTELPDLLLDDGRGTVFGAPVAQRGLAPLDHLVHLSFPGIPDPAAASLRIGSAADPRCAVSVPLTRRP